MSGAASGWTAPLRQVLDESTMPRRIQRQRTAGWRMPAGAMYVGRGTLFGNPFDWNTLGRPEAVLRHRLWLQGAGRDTHTVSGYQYSRTRVLAAIEAGELRGRTLACWCPPGQPCHAETLIKLANQPRGN